MRDLQANWKELFLEKSQTWRQLSGWSFVNQNPIIMKFTFIHIEI